MRKIGGFERIENKIPCIENIVLWKSFTEYISLVLKRKQNPTKNRKIFLFTWLSHIFVIEAC